VAQGNGLGSLDSGLEIDLGSGLEIDLGSGLGSGTGNGLGSLESGRVERSGELAWEMVSGGAWEQG